jgi:hypothetical protein
VTRYGSRTSPISSRTITSRPPKKRKLWDRSVLQIPTAHLLLAKDKEKTP